MARIYPYFSENLKIKKELPTEFFLTNPGFLYGYGLFETILIKNSKPRLIDKHLQRLSSSANTLKIPFDFNRNDIKKMIENVVQINQVEDARLNIYLTAKDIKDNNVVLLIVLKELPPKKDLDKAFALDIKKAFFPRTNLDSHKSMAYLKNICEKRAAQDFDDVILYDHEKNILETTSANIFFIKGKTVITPQSKVILPGIARNFVINNLAKLDLTIQERKVHLTELADFEEVFLTNSLRGVIKVKNIKGYPRLSSGSITKEISFLFQSSAPSA
ncbi:aminotransferase class IV [Candidatus Margulisiibacteriota bacterium]